MTVVTLPIPRNEVDFEDLVLEVAEEKLKPDAAQPYGRRGAGQDGIDHQLRLIDSMWLGIQCKRYWDTKLTPKLLQKDLDAAHAIVPPLARYLVATTKRASTELQDWARSATIHGHASVDIWFWDDIERWLNADPARLNRYDQRPPIVLAQGLLLQVGGTKPAQEIVAFAASPAASVGNDSADPESVKAAGVLLQAGHPRQAFDRLARDREALSPVASVWRVSASALYMLGDPAGLIALAQRATTLGIHDTRLRALEAAGHRAQGDVERARAMLQELLAKASAGAERFAVLNHWLNLRLEEDHATYEALSADVTPADRADPNLHLPLAQAALFFCNGAEFDEHVAILEAAPEKLGEWVPQMLRAMAPIIDGERRGVREGVPLRDAALRQRIEEAITRLDSILQRQFSDTPHASNRQRALVWRARGAVLIGNLELADASYSAALDAGKGDATTMKQAAQYASEFDRRAFWDGLLDRAPAKDDPLFAMAQASRRAQQGDAGARHDMRRLEEALPPDDERRAQAIAGRLYLPFDPADTAEAVERGLVELARAKEPDALVVGLALQLKEAKLTDDVLEKIRVRLRAINGASLNVMTHLTAAAILSDAEEFELRSGLQPARDAAVDETGDALPRDAALQAVQLALNEMRLARAAHLVERYFPASDTDRLAWRLRATLALKQGDLQSATGFLSRIIEHKLATAKDASQWAWYARALGQGLQARRLFRRDRFPQAETARQVSSLAHALAHLFRTRDYQRLLSDAGDRIANEAELFPATAAATLSGRSAPAPEVVAVDTIAVLRRQDSGEPRMVWITDQAGPSSPPFLRVQRNESWLEPLIGRSEGAVVTFGAGAFAGEWTVEQILPGAAGTQSRLMEWAVRQGIAGGGVDSVKVDDDPVGAITRRLQEDKAKQKPPPADVPIAMIAHVRQCMPFRFLGHLERPRCFFGRAGELEYEVRIAERSPPNSPVYVDPLTILIAEQLGISDVLIRAAGRVRVMAQSQLTLVGWWWEEREHRHARASASLSPDGRMIFQEHTPVAREWGRQLWRAIGLRRQDPRIEIVDTYPDAAGQALSGLSDSIDPGTLSTLAATAGTSNLYASIDANLVGIARSLEGTLHVHAISVFGILRWGVQSGRISWLECAHAIAQVSRGNWSFVAVGSAELAAVLTSKDRGGRNADLAALLRDFSISEPKGAVNVVAQALDRIAGGPAAIRSRAMAERLFRSLPAMPRAARAAFAPSHKGRWYSAVLRAWRKNGS